MFLKAPFREGSWRAFWPEEGRCRTMKQQQTIFCCRWGMWGEDSRGWRGCTPPPCANMCACVRLFHCVCVRFGSSRLCGSVLSLSLVCVPAPGYVSMLTVGGHSGSMAGEKNERFTFNVEWFDQVASLTRQYQLYYFPNDATLEMVQHLLCFPHPSHFRSCEHVLSFAGFPSPSSLLALSSCFPLSSWCMCPHSFATLPPPLID